MTKKKPHHGEDAKLRSALDHSDNSQESQNGYMERGNPSVYAAKGRVMRNNDNGSHV
ncbi:hypothetical protein [Clostridium scatologenes]|uniref:Uncharacterized protein n=1 Tax=Clostridium scatologenes TaxID=1548 RepID=A0A0E3GSL1_CLOSL|nr:hypothetical protein [Clostridium scatologenes]AKA72261.1 hypothetical protein CSCA_5136 [Clostridium scatologenes]